MRIAQRKESPIIGLTGMGGGLASYILYGGSGSSVYEISRSLRLNDGDSPRLFRYVPTGGNRRTFTISFWTKRGDLGIDGNIFNASSNPGGSSSSAERTEFRFNPTNDQIKFAVNPTGNSWITLETVAQFRDPSAWLHVVVSVDTTQSTETNRVKIYVNGEEQALTGDYIGENVETPYNKSGNTMSIGSYTNNNNAFYDGYLADFHFVDGQALADSDFGETDTYGIWNPKEFTGSHGTNGFHLKFDDASSSEALGKDSSGNGTRLPAVHFSGNNDCIEIPDSSDFTFGADDFTMEMWVMPREFTSYQAFFMKHTATRSTSSVWTSLKNDGSILYYLYHGSSETGMTTSGSGLNLNKWNHIAFVRQGTTARCYINGVQEGTMNISTNTVNDSSTPMRLGMDANDAYDFDGFISNARIVKGTCLYNDGTTFTPPTAPLTNVTNTVLLCCQSETSSSAATVTPNPLVLYSDNGDLSPVSKSELDYDPVNLIAAQSTSEGYSDYVYAGDATYDNTETSKNYFDGTGRSLFNGTLAGQVGSQNISEAWLYFRPATGITNVTSLRLYGSYNQGGTKINGTDSSSVWPNANLQWINIENPPSTITEIAVKGGSGAAARLQAIEINGVLLTDPKAVNDNMVDSPSLYTADSGNNGGNYATLNNISKGVATLSDGNLKYESDSGSHHCVASTLAVSSGKWYWEYEVLSTGTYHYAGIADIDTNFEGNWCGSNSGWSVSVRADGAICWNNVENHGNVGSSISAGDILGWALDLDSATPTLKLYINGAIQNSGNSVIPTATSLTGRTIVAAAGHSDHKHLIFNFGQRSFVHTPPTGHVALNTQYFSEPTILDPSEQVGVVTYTGDADTKNITSLNFSPDFVWAKDRDDNYHHGLFDRVRGPNKAINSSSASEEDVRTNQLMSFDSNGFTLGDNSDSGNYVNRNNIGYVAWNWNAGANSNRTYNVKVVSDSGNKYRFNDHGTSAVTLDLEEGSTYVFDSSDSSVNSHPFVLGTAANSGQYGTGVTYTLDGVEKTYSQYTSGFSAATTRKLTITVPSGAPTLYYWCSVHSGMGGQINTGSGGSTILSNSLTSSAYNTSQTWSSSSGTGVSNAANIFDGTFSNGGTVSSTGTARTLYDSETGFSARRIRFYKNGNNEGVTYVGVNGTDYAFPYSYTATGWQEVDLGSTITVTTLTTSWAPGSFTLYAIEVDGAILTDSTVTPPTTPAKNAIVRANPTAGFSIIKYVTSNADTVAQGTFATGLGGPPEMVLMKTLYDGGQGWTVYHKDIPDPTENYLYLDGTNFMVDSNTATFSTSHYTFGCRGSRNVAGNDRDIIVYAWRSIPGYSKIGSWDSNNSADGNFIYLGFKPRWVMVKAVDNVGDVNYASWLILDTERDKYNVSDASLFANKSEAEGKRGNGSGTAGTYMDLLSNGFKIRYSGTEVAGASNQTFAYMAFAEHPFRTSRAR